MEGEPMVSYSTGAMTSLLDKLNKPKNHPNLTDDFSKLIEELHRDLERLKKDLLDKFEGRGGTDERVKVWMKQVRELVFDIEDRIDQRPATDMGESEREEIEDFKTQIQEARERCTRYDLLSKALTDLDHPADTLLSKVTIDSGLAFEEKTGLVAVDGPRNKLVEHLANEQEKMQMVVSIVGMGGLGKTTLAKEIYAKLQVQGKFECQAFVTIGRRRSMRATLMDILRQVNPESTIPRDGRGSPDVQQLITELREYLGTKRYFILIDDIWSTWAWKVINCALPDKNLGSRVLTTTCIKDVAESCSIHPSDVVHQMEALSEDDSKSLFDAGAHKPPDDILKMCGGMPLAIIVAAGLLPRKSAGPAEPQIPEKYILSASDQYSTSEGMRKILHMSYADLPAPLKSCFLYLSLFPENYTIKKDRLIRLWGAEGFIPRRYEESLWVTGERYFNELISRRLIQPVFSYEDDQAVGCTVHGVILDFIRSLSREGNFTTSAAELRSGPFPCDTIRRFSLDCWGNEDEADILASRTVHLRSMRSLTVFGDVEWTALPTDSDDTERMAGHSALTDSGDNEGIPVLPSFKLLRVLDLEDADNLRSHHLQGIGGLVLLRYLGLQGTDIHELPEEIGKLEHLETLDVRRTNLSSLPASIVGLKRLVRLLLDGAVKLPIDICMMQGLEEVSTIGDDSRSSLDSVSELLRKSEGLRVLGISFAESNPRSWTVQHFLSVVAMYTKLRSLSLCVDSSVLDLLRDFPLPPYLPDRIILRDFPLPPHLPERYELTVSSPIRGVRERYLHRIFYHVTHLHIEITRLEEKHVYAIGNLRRLVLLQLVSSGSDVPISGILSSSRRRRRRRGGRGRCVIVPDGFSCLRVFWFTCKAGGNQLQFNRGAMPQLRRLRLSFSARETLSSYGNFDFGIGHLTGLTRAHAIINCRDATISEVEFVEAAIREQVSRLPIKPTIEFSREQGDMMMLEDKGTIFFKAKKMFSLLGRRPDDNDKALC